MSGRSTWASAGRRVCLPCARADGRLDIEYDGTRFAGWARQPGRRTVQDEVERALAVLLPRAGRADGRGAHGQRRARQRAGRLVRGRAGAADGPERAAAGRRRRHEHATPARDGLRRAPRRALARATATACCARRAALGRSSAAGRCGGRTGWTATLLHACAALLPGHARLHRLHADRDLPPALRARRPRGALGGRRATSLAFEIEADAFMRNMNRILVGTMLAGRRRAPRARRLRRAARGRAPRATRVRPRRRTGSA